MNKRKLVALGLTYFLALNLFACGGNGDLTTPVIDELEDDTHAPVLSDAYLSSTAAFLMQGGGLIEVSARIEYLDPEGDVTHLKILMSDRRDLTANVSDLAQGTEGVFWFTFDISTSQAGEISVEFWLVDSASNASNHKTVLFQVLNESGAWVERVSGMAFALNDVHWNGWQFLAVGDGGTIMTSPDGIDWTYQDSGVDEDLHAIGWDLYDYIVVGEKGTVLGSVGGNGDEWFVQHSGPDNALLLAVAHHAWPVIAAGENLDTKQAVMYRSMDHGDTWEEIVDFPLGGGFVRDLVFGPGQYVATIGFDGQFGAAKVWRSTDGIAWSEVLLSWDMLVANEIIYGDGGYWVAGSRGSVFTSLDADQWTMVGSPLVGTSLQGIANLGQLVVAAGRNYDWDWGVIQSGVSTGDGGTTWETFSITVGFDYETRGMACGAGRFVSVGRAVEDPGAGAIFSTE